MSQKKKTKQKKKKKKTNFQMESSGDMEDNGKKKCSYSDIRIVISIYQFRKS
jgi:hypothetical protein